MAITMLKTNKVKSPSIVASLAIRNSSNANRIYRKSSIFGNSELWEKGVESMSLAESRGETLIVLPGLQEERRRRMRIYAAI